MSEVKITIKNVTKPMRYQGPLCDSHLHAFKDPKKVIADFKRRYAHRAEGGTLIFYGDFSLGRLLQDMNELNCRYGIIKNIADINPKDPNARSIIEANCWAMGVKEYWPNFFAFGTIHLGFEELAGYSAMEEIQHLALHGIRGLSFDSCWQSFRPEAPEMFPLYQEMAKLNLVALFHVGWDEGSKYPKNLTWAEHILKIHNEVPQLKIIACHLGPPLPGTKEPNLLGVPNIWLDIAYIPQAVEIHKALKTDTVLKIIEKHGVNRILFGSDYPWADPGFSVDYLWSLPLTEEEKIKILYGNFLELFGLT